MDRKWTIKGVLDWATADFSSRGMDSPRLEAEILLAHLLRCERIRLYTDFDRPLEEGELARYREAIARRRKGVPSAHITGRREFWSIELEVSPEVLVPRPDTETLVEAALEVGPGESVLDLCTGSGCVVIALASERPKAEFDATDISPAACEIARANADRQGLAERITVFEGDLFDAVPDGKTYDMIVSNPPYVTTGEIPTLSPEVRNEPALALDGGPDGLDIIRRILEGAHRHLNPGGAILIELDPRQAEIAAGELGERALGVRGRIVKDLAGRARVVAWEIPQTRLETK